MFHTFFVNFFKNFAVGIWLGFLGTFSCCFLRMGALFSWIVDIVFRMFSVFFYVFFKKNEQNDKAIHAIGGEGRWDGAWMYVFWRGGLVVLGYMCLDREEVGVVEMELLGYMSLAARRLLIYMFF